MSLLAEATNYQQSHFQIPSDISEEHKRQTLIDECTLIRSLKRALQLNLKAQNYDQATFFADKIYQLTPQPGSSQYNLHVQNLAAGGPEPT